MSSINEVKSNMFHVMRQAVKFSLNFQGKGTLLENKTIEYKMQLLENLEQNSDNYKKLSVQSPDFNLLLSKTRKVLSDLQESNYSEQVKRYINDVSYMFENDLKSIAKIIPVQKEQKPKEEIILKQEDIICSCGCTKLTDEDIIKFRKINVSQIIKCKKCDEVLITLLTEEDKIKDLINKNKQEEEDLNMSSLKLIGEF